MLNLIVGQKCADDESNIKQRNMNENREGRGGGENSVSQSVASAGV